MKTVMLTVVFVALLGVAQPVSAQWPLGDRMTPKLEKSPPQMAVSGTGRFQVFVSPHMKDRTFMIDTDTGRIWIFQKDHTSGDYKLKRVPVEGLPGEPSSEDEATNKTSSPEKTGDDE